MTPIQLVMSCFARSLRRRLSDEKLDAAFAALPPVTPLPPLECEAEAATVEVAALQMEAALYRNAHELVADLDRYFSMAGEARLVCFPELLGLLLFSLLPPVRLAFQLMAKKNERTAQNSGQPAPQQEPEKQASSGAGLLAHMFAPFDFLQERYLALFGRFARRYGVYVSCGTLFVCENSRVYNRHLLIEPDGALLDYADKIHPTAEEQAMGLAAGERLPVVRTPIGNIALCVCMDATYFETFRIAKALEADYIIVPIGDVIPQFDEWLARRGASARAVECSLVAIKSALTAPVSFAVAMSGRAGIYFPFHLREQTVETAEFSGAGVARATLNLAALRQSVPPPFCRENAGFDHNYIQALLSRTQ